jgi:prepilin-type N-terminal cleavage/methylation domain-containing protein
MFTFGTRRFSDKRAFTLMELMTVVFIIGILAAVSIPEAQINIRKLYDGEVSYYNEEITTATGSVLSKRFITADATPATPGLNKSFGNFSTPEWGALKFAPDGPVLYSYSTVSGGVGASASFTARAEGDIDGDGTTSVFERVAEVDSVTGEVQGGGALFTLDELE